MGWWCQCNRNTNISIFWKYKFIYFNWRLITLQYCIGFAMHQHESTTGIHVLSILNPPPYSLATPSLWVISVHQPQASSIMRQTWTGYSFLIWYYKCFNAILPNHPTLSLPQRDGTGREEGGGFRMGNTCIPVADSCRCMAKPIQYCKVINLQLNKFIF